MKLLVLAPLLFVSPALAQEAPKPPEMVMLPRPVAEAAAQWIEEPNAGNAVRLYATMAACIADNPHNGLTTRTGPDQCSSVTDALAAQAKQVDDLTKERDALKAKAAVPAAPKAK